MAAQRIPAITDGGTGTQAAITPQKTGAGRARDGSDSTTDT